MLKQEIRWPFVLDCRRKVLPLHSLFRTYADKQVKGGYQSGQMGQTVNLLALPSVVRIHHHPLLRIMITNVLARQLR